jgi:RimJ/RimL family protein N-acetyltransferase
MTVNIASRRVLEKSGLVLVGTLLIDWAAPIEGAEQGDVIYAVDRHVWLRSA